MRQLGPGLITGAADDDPSGIATYSQAGAQFGYGLLWTVVFTFPLMVGIQLVSARLGCLTGRGLAANIKRVFPRPLLYAVVALLLAANLINVAADVAAMGAGLKLLLGGSAHVYSLTFGCLCLLLQVFLPYRTYVRYLKWLTLALLSYVAVAFTVQVPWSQVLGSSLWPGLSLDSGTLTMIVAVLGTTISPYLFFWQAAEEMEDSRQLVRLDANRQLEPQSENAVRGHLRRIKWDTCVGMGFSNLIAFFIILSTAATLHAAGITDIQTSAQAAEALRPAGGEFTFLLFSMGIIGTGLLAVPVLAGSAAYAVAEALDWRNGLDRKLHEAKSFYGIIALATLGGVALDFTSADPIRELLWSAMINGVIAVPIMAVMMLLGGRRDVLGQFVIDRKLRRLGWFATCAMALAVVAMLVSLWF
ncbi:MAG TPA: Nramp family divalent metal transporter [Steroidobacteraceae bacterium]|nr:Nramp family divalent metal transporter [Steroidobacteraceae bacterium]